MIRSRILIRICSVSKRFLFLFFIFFLQITYYCDTGCQRAGWSTHRAECAVLVRVRPREPPALVRLLLRVLARHRAAPHHAEPLPAPCPPRALSHLVTHAEEVARDQQRVAAFQTFLRVLQDCVGTELYDPSEVFAVFCKVLVNAVEITDPLGDAIGTGGTKITSCTFS